MRRVLRAGAEIKHGQKLRAGVDGQPEHLSGAAQPSAQFIQLQIPRDAQRDITCSEQR
jgi:hypothetical protein